MNESNKQMREQREFETLFKNPKHARSMWAQTVIDRYSKPAMPPAVIVDDKGNPTKESQLEEQIWHYLKNELQAAGLDRDPTEGEMMEACQSYYARHNPAAYVARRDSMGAKPIDETKITVAQHNPLEDLSDEELEVMQKALEQHHREVLERQQVQLLSEAEVNKKDVVMVNNGNDEQY